MTAATRGSAELLALALWSELVEKTDRTSPEEYPDMALITFEELREFIARLAAKPDEDPDAMNEKRALEDTKLASNVREATIRECVAIAKAHKGAAARARRAKGKVLHMGTEAYDEIVAEERGEDIASEIIEREMLALSTTGRLKP